MGRLRKQWEQAASRLNDRTVSAINQAQASASGCPPFMAYPLWSGRRGERPKRALCPQVKQQSPVPGRKWPCFYSLKWSKCKMFKDIPCRETRTLKRVQGQLRLVSLTNNFAAKYNQVLVCYVKERGLIERQSLLSRHWWAPFPGQHSTERKHLQRARTVASLSWAQASSTALCYRHPNQYSPVQLTRF